MAIVVLKSAGIVAWVLYLTHWAGPKLTLICTYVSARLWHQDMLLLTRVLGPRVRSHSHFFTVCDFLCIFLTLNFHPYTNTQWMIWDDCCYHIPAHPRLFTCSTGTHTCQSWDKRGQLFLCPPSSTKPLNTDTGLINAWNWYSIYAVTLIINCTCCMVTHGNGSYRWAEVCFISVDKYLLHYKQYFCFLSVPFNKVTAMFRPES